MIKTPKRFAWKAPTFFQHVPRKINSPRRNILTKIENPCHTCQPPVNMLIFIWFLWRVTPFFVVITCHALYDKRFCPHVPWQISDYQSLLCILTSMTRISNLFRVFYRTGYTLSDIIQVEIFCFYTRCKLFCRYFFKNNNSQQIILLNW